MYESIKTGHAGLIQGEQYSDLQKEKYGFQ
jgi:hypothetical protein